VGPFSFRVIHRLPRNVTKRGFGGNKRLKIRGRCRKCWKKCYIGLSPDSFLYARMGQPKGASERRAKVKAVGRDGTVEAIAHILEIHAKEVLWWMERLYQRRNLPWNWLDVRCNCFRGKIAWSGQGYRSTLFGECLS
jgi:hypothetical protein